MSGSDYEDKIQEHHETMGHQGHGESLTRQITMSISPEQYERLFFQPTQARGDLSKRLGNPTLLGLMGFLIPFQSTVFCILEFQGGSTASLPALVGSFYFFGGICMVLAGLAEFILGNTFPFTVFTIFGAHWVQVGFANDPVMGLAASYAEGGALNPAYNAGAGFYNVNLCLICFVFFIGSLRTNLPFVLVFFVLVFLFAFFAAANFHIGHYGAAGVPHALYLIKIAGGFGLVSTLLGWYLAIITVCASTGVPCPLPIFDLSQKVFPHTKAAADEAAGAGGGAVARE